MKKKHFCLGKIKISHEKLHWIGFFLVVGLIGALTLYGFLVSFTPNSRTFDSAPESPLALVGVALVNNLGTDTPRANEIPVDLPADVPLVQDFLIRDSRDGSFFSEHFTRISELTEVLNIDVVNYLTFHEDKTEALESYISQLEEKKAEADEAYASLGQLNSLHTNALKSTKDDIKNTQAQIESSYNDRDGDSIMEYLTKLEELHIQEQEHTNISVFAIRVGKEYKALTDAAIQKIIVLKANIEPLSKGVTVKLPEGINIEALRSLQLFADQTN